MESPVTNERIFQQHRHIEEEKFVGSASSPENSGRQMNFNQGLAIGTESAGFNEATASILSKKVSESDKF